MQYKPASRQRHPHGADCCLATSLQPTRLSWKPSPTKQQHFTTIQPSLYSLAAESTKLISDIHLPRPKPLRPRKDKRSESEMLGRSQEESSSRRELGFHRYSRELRQSEMVEGRLLKKIIDQYKIKSLERSYYDNLVSNLGMKISNGVETQPRIKVKGNIKLSRNKDRTTFKHLNSLELDSLLDSPIKVKAQSINPSLKEMPVEPKCRATSGTKGLTASSKKGQSSEDKLRVLEMSENVVVQKVNKYKEFLFAVNWAHRIYRDLDIQIYSQPFRVYVGPGNNRNLIRSILKQRFWLEETKHKQDAHLVWTQLKEETLFRKQDKQAERLSFDQKGEKSQVGFREESVVVYKSKEGDAKREKSQQAAKIQFKPHENLEPHSRILTPSQLQAYELLMQKYIYKRKGLFRERLKYTGLLATAGPQQLSETTIHNHLPLNGLLGNKKAMFHMLKHYYNQTNRNIFDVVPLTYHIRNVADQQFQDFTHQFHQHKALGKPNVWIVKPGEFSNRGQGIQCVGKVEEVRLRSSQLGYKKSLIVQEYLASPLLYNGRKFDIRAFMLISVNNGFLRAYWYQEGYIRTSSHYWRLSSLSDPYMHLTNDAVQLNGDDYGKFQPANKLSYAELERYLESLPKQGNSKEPLTFQSHIHPALKAIATDAVKATFPFIDPGRHSSNFQIFGFDFMIDSSLKPWLIEINTNPCLELSCPLLRRIIPSMLENAFRLAVDPVFPPPLNYTSTYKYAIPQNALHYNKFELIFDQERDGGNLEHLLGTSSPMQELQDYEEDKEVYEEEGEEIEVKEK